MELGIYNGTRNLTQQGFQTPSHFVMEEMFETIPTTAQQSISPIHPTQTTPYSKSIPFPQTTTQTTVKPCCSKIFANGLLNI